MDSKPGAQRPAPEGAAGSLTPGTRKLVDTATGEMLAVLVPKRKRVWRQGEEWVTLVQAAADVFADADLSRTAHRVLWVLIARLDFENWVTIAQADVARRLGLSRSVVSEAFTELRELDVVIQGPRVGRSYTWRLSPSAIWKGRSADRVKALHDVARDRFGLDADTPLVIEDEQDA